MAAEADANTEVSATEHQEQQSGDGWEPVPQASWAPAADVATFREVRLRKRCSALKVDVATEQAPPEKVQWGPVLRSHVVVQLEACAFDADEVESGSAEFFEFRLGEKYGYRLAGSPPPKGSGSWLPPRETERIDIAPWLTVAVLAIALEGHSAEFEPAEPDEANSSETANIVAGGLVGRHRLSLLQIFPTSDLLADEGIILRTLEPGPTGVKPRDLSRVTASWRVWFLRNSELVMSTFSETNVTGAVEFVLDDGTMMVAIQLALKDMLVGTRACLRVSEDWAQGALLPSGSPVLRGAAVWAEIVLIASVNEPAPGEHSSVSDAVAFALDKKLQGNRNITLQNDADWGRAVRRYEAGIKTLEAVLPGRRSASTSVEQKSLADQQAPVALEEELPSVHEALTALRLNAAQGELKRRHWKSAAELCDVVLLKTAGHPKALYRRGLARLELGEYDGAVEDLHSAAAANPSDANLRKELARAQEKRCQHRAAERNTFGGVFDKVKEDDEKIRRRAEAEAKAEADAAAKVKA